jgi:hypothetical protein
MSKGKAVCYLPTGGDRLAVPDAPNRPSNSVAKCETTATPKVMMLTLAAVSLGSGPSYLRNEATL